MLKEIYKGYSPWGEIQSSEMIYKGFKVVSTAGHGGYMIAETFADKYLSVACKKRAYYYYGYLCYEEDCCYAIVDLDLLINHPKKFKDKLLNKEATLDGAKEYLIKYLSRHYPEYLIEIGIEPYKEHYQIHLDEKMRHVMRINRNSDLIISAININKDIIKVRTSDGKIHYVNADSYKAIKENVLLLLSDCITINYKEEGDL